MDIEIGLCLWSFVFRSICWKWYYQSYWLIHLCHLFHPIWSCLVGFFNFLFGLKQILRICLWCVFPIQYIQCWIAHWSLTSFWNVSTAELLIWPSHHFGTMSTVELLWSFELHDILGICWLLNYSFELHISLGHLYSKRSSQHLKMCRTTFLTNSFLESNLLLKAACWLTKTRGNHLHPPCFTFDRPACRNCLLLYRYLPALYLLFASVFSSPEVTFVLTFIQCPIHPCVAAVWHKRPWSFCQKCWWHVTPKYAYTLDPTKSEWADCAAVQA